MSWNPVLDYFMGIKYEYDERWKRNENRRIYE